VYRFIRQGEIEKAQQLLIQHNYYYLSGVIESLVCEHDFGRADEKNINLNLLSKNER
jgi:hypothetical protein